MSGGELDMMNVERKPLKKALQNLNNNPNIIVVFYLLPTT